MRGKDDIGLGLVDLCRDLLDRGGGKGRVGALPVWRAFITMCLAAKPPASKIWLQR